ncbi:MAG: DUF4249 family protein [Bacteroidales bacterium]|nr:DUF4249 family protein [Bacteroidales bacterium]
MKKSTLIYLVSLLTLVSGCIYPFSVEHGEGEFSDIVVSGNILIGETTRITLGYVYPVGTPPSEMRRQYPTGTLTVESDSGLSWKGSYQYRGLYTFDTSEAPAEGSYRLRITLDDGTEYLSEWSAVCSAPQISNLRAMQAADVVQVVMDIKGGEGQWSFRWDYTQTWEYHADFRPDLMFIPGLPEKDREDPSKIYRLPEADEDYYYCWSSAASVEPGLASAEGQSINEIHNAEVITIPCTDVRISHLYCIDVTASSLSATGRAWQQHLKDVSNDTGSLFSPTPSDMEGNIKCTTDPSLTAIGYIDAVCRTQSRLFIGPQFYRRGYNPDDWIFIPDPDEDGFYNFDNLFINNSPVRCNGTPSKTNVYWGPKRCTDCRASGGSKAKPDWWPNNDK